MALSRTYRRQGIEGAAFYNVLQCKFCYLFLKILIVVAAVVVTITIMISNNFLLRIMCQLVTFNNSFNHQNNPRK